MASQWSYLTASPALPRLFLQAALRRKVTGTVLPEEGLRCWVSVNRQQVEAYRKVCGFPDSSLMPPTYLHVLAFALQMQIMTGKNFPFPLLGLIHLRNSISVHRPLGGIGQVRVSVHVGNLQPHAKGATFSLITEVEDALGSLWEEDCTLLCRGMQLPGEPPSDFESAPLPLSEVTRWQAPADIGRHYAKVSGDYNPIHLSATSAKMFGFPTAIAHGLWLKARTLAALDDHLPAANVHISAEFQKPVRLPSDVTLSASAAGSSGQFRLTGSNPDLVHMIGSWQPLT
ncbi:MaoC/PaaZ C-terminal domain-containing protein [Pseudomonas sp. 10B1]|uniref:MaoC family dehydratase n=1 Tax=unclassified Pseudomonas TaxID=196821 RepID=UPI002AB4B9AA|nr:MULTISPECIES: MaoC/PaaZ C-terminal domain-containing protein [unclassified Pseudomonas]MDY7563235.1 MaoC/PaaZ C-terminal domain-containing protein [Pseudomonas sp. AB6]MEA9977631.1 MaoC/PaaZ C-terminal domain-containing protein [Pseudomonas sp. RTS4]MEA9993683.1 MaoC/PaaZ C-terminal domain-containing protein [Pseudomonas sp. AA4]MEB0085024.1 MaoC/PaaZ C-terminal domain-containing protein [Pseudomonas sp. RTI1]MEB0125127.1 MaoC/PaaZ C-terminal domain-containing protein [Pseudomonas sp. CCC1.